MVMNDTHKQTAVTPRTVRIEVMAMKVLLPSRLSPCLDGVLLLNFLPPSLSTTASLDNSHPCATFMALVQSNSRADFIAGWAIAYQWWPFGLPASGSVLGCKRGLNLE